MPGNPQWTEAPEGGLRHAVLCEGPLQATTDLTPTGSATTTAPPASPTPPIQPGGGRLRRRVPRRAWGEVERDHVRIRRNHVIRRISETTLRERGRWVPLS